MNDDLKGDANDSILASIKKLLGITNEYTHFDPDIIMHINSVFPILNQLGVGPKDGFFISDNLSTWKDFLGDDERLLSVISYTHLKVKMVFDPPLSSVVMEAIKHRISELEWRLNVAADGKVN